MEITILKLGVEIRGLKLKDKDHFEMSLVENIKKLVHQHRIVIFKDQGEVSGQKHVDISKWFGDLDGTVFEGDPLFAHRKCPHPNVHRISNDPEEGCTNAGRSGWHIDGSFVEKPHGYALYHMPAVPRKGATEFVGFKELLESIPNNMRGNWERLWMVNDKGDKLVQPLVYSHPVTGLPTNQSYMSRNKVNEYDGYERTALHYAAERDIFCVEMLLEHGANINIGDDNFDTPLHWATFKNNIQCVKLLLQIGAKVDLLDFNNDTPLSWAARKGHAEIIQILLDYNADGQIVNLKDVSPVEKAVQIQTSGLNTENDNKSLDLLLKATCKLTLTESQEQTIKEDNRLTELLASRFEMPCSLQGQCRYSIRRSLGYRYLPNVIPKLPVPSRLRDYIALKC